MWVSNEWSWDYEYHSLPTELAGVYDFNEETVFVNDHLFFAFFVELFSFFQNIEELKSYFFICGQALRQMELRKIVFWIL